MFDLFLDFYGISVSISSVDSIAQLLKKDFEYFNCAKIQHPTFVLSVEKSISPYNEIAGLKAIRQNEKCITYKDSGYIFNDYHGAGFTVYDPAAKKMSIYSLDEQLLHEITYLAVLSLTGKLLDLRGMHRLHAFAISYKSTALIGMMPSKGGKSTLFLDLLKSDSEFKIISDDTPYIDWRGKLYPFPIRVGTNDITGYADFVNIEKSYELVRRDHGVKTLIPVSAIPNKIHTDVVERIILFEGARIYSNECELHNISSLKIFIAQIKHVIIGVGLPMVLEYFLEPSIKDIPKRIIIIVKRSLAAFNLARKSSSYTIYLGLSRETNVKIVSQLLKQQRSEEI